MGSLVHRQILQLKFTCLEDAQYWSPRFSELNQRIILPELDRVFSAAAKEQTLRIDRLEIDLGRLRQIDLDVDLARIVRQKLWAALQPYMPVPLNVGPGAGPFPASQACDRPPLAEEPQFDAGSLAELFEKFLLTGLFPWWVKRQQLSQFDRLYRVFWRRAPDDARRLILQSLSGPTGLSRFVEQFSNRSHQLTLQQLLPRETGALLIDLRKLAARLLARQGLGLQARVLSFKLAYSMIVGDDQAQLEQPQTMVRHFFIGLSQISGISTAQLTEAVDLSVSQLRISSASKTVLAEQLRKAGSLAVKKDRRREDVDGSYPLVAAAEDSLLAPVEPEGVAIENAGLVLLWPHLAELFRKLDLLKAGADGTVQPKVEATLLLQQLVTGQPSGPESQLSLNKRLCGLPQSIPTPRRLRRTPQWDAEVETLLTVVIEQWAALKNTSVAGLRSTFLQREGILREQQQGWTLQVERKTHDILLEHLPWGLGMIKLSWMRMPLRVEW